MWAKKNTTLNEGDKDLGGSQNCKKAGEPGWRLGCQKQQHVQATEVALLWSFCNLIQAALQWLTIEPLLFKDMNFAGVGIDLPFQLFKSGTDVFWLAESRSEKKITGVSVFIKGGILCLSKTYTMENSPNMEQASDAGWEKTNDKCLFITFFHSFLISASG